MKLIKAAVLVSIVAMGTSASAGNPLPPIDDPEPVMPTMPEPSSSSGGLIIPLLLAALVLAAAS